MGMSVLKSLGVFAGGAALATCIIIPFTGQPDLDAVGDRFEDLKGKFGLAQEANALWEEEVGSLESQIHNHLEEIALKEEDLKSLRNDLLALETERDQLLANIDLKEQEKQEAIAEKQKEIEAKQAEIDAKQVEIDNKNVEYAALQTDFERVTKERNQAIGESQNYKKAYEEQQVETEKANDAVSQLRSEIEESYAEVADEEIRTPDNRDEEK